MSYRKCCIPGCESNRSNALLHKFPKSETGLKKWVKCIGINDLQCLNSEQLQKRFVCHKHFERKMYAGERYLRISAYPSLFSKTEMESGISKAGADFGKSGKIAGNAHQDHTYSNKRTCEDDHTYCKKLEKINIDTDAPSSSPCKYVQQQLSLRDIDALSESPCEDVQQQLYTRDPNASSTWQSEVIEQEQLYLRDVNTPTTSCLRKKGKQRLRMIKNVENMTPKCRRLYRQYKLSKKKLNFMNRAKRAQKFSKEQYFEKITRNLNPLARKIFWLQIRNCTKPKMGRRYTEDEKLIALSIMKQSPKAYKYLQRIFILPSKRILDHMIQNLSIESGINPQIFYAIKKEVENWPENKKYCSIIFDEVALEPGLSYDKHKDNICGFVELGNKTPQFADHALVFMIRGALYKWQQPICFYFCEGATSSANLKRILKEVTIEVIGTGLLPKAFISDQGTAFRSALNSLQEESRRDKILAGKEIDDTINIGGHNIYIIYDPPHLIKGMRNNFLNKNILFQRKLCQWSDIVDVYTTDCKHTKMRLLHKLNDEHVIPEKIKKMKVKNCTKVLSHTVGSALAYTSEFSHYIDGRQVSATLSNTSSLIMFLDELFDSCNGVTLVDTKGKPLRSAVKETSQHLSFWREAISKLENMRFINKDKKEVTVPSQKNFITTLKSLKQLWMFFKSKGIKHMRPRYFNSDPLENFFGQVRSYNFRNNDPSCQAFKHTFRSLLITRFIHFHSENFNCEDASGEQLLKLKNLINVPAEVNSHQSYEIPEASSSQAVTKSGILIEDIQAEARKERLNVHSQAYTAGWVIRKCLKITNCKTCANDMCQEDASEVHKWITHKEFKKLKTKKQRLTYPADNAVRLFTYAVKEANEYLESTPTNNKISLKIHDVIRSKYSFDFITCEDHKDILLEYFINYSVKLTIINWCSVIDKILRGVDIMRLSNMSLPFMQNRALIKYKKKLKNKKLNK